MAFKGFKAGTISLDEPRSIYYSGQVLTGKILFELDEILTFTAIKVAFIGQAIVKWSEYQTEKYSGVERTREIEYYGQDPYFNFEQCLCGGSVTTLPAGPQSISFSYLIPSNVPSSFQGAKGQVKYTIKAYLEYPDSTRYELTTDFDVIAPLDLNTIDCIKNPIAMEFEEVSSCNCFCQEELINVKIQLPVSGYCPGQIMKIQIDSQNNTGSEVTKILFQLIKKERYHSQQPISTYMPPEEVLYSLVQGPILAHTKRSFTCQMRVPNIIAYNLENCRVIDVAYFLKVKLKMSGCIDDVEDECELCIGLVPLRETVEGTYVHPMSFLLPQAPLPTTTQNIQTYPNNTCPLPVPNVPNVTSLSNNAQAYPTNTPCPIPTLNAASLNNQPSYVIGFKVPGMPAANTSAYPLSDKSAQNRYSNEFPKPSAPPL
ncbi:arrestin domain-containing protein 1-like [Zerene cesonia]|uniref:arrestin domain-containing protein 1-like n=1 Tax=Zerene cesonia TaxID=33412 RepID=UPI0018E50F23|nr:arrestin domain-containing protein 1-like [Zerene cesonia]